MANYYLPDLTWADLTQAASQVSQNMRDTLQRGVEEYNEWQRFRAGRDNATIASAIGKTAGQVADLDACYSAMKNIYDYANNLTPAQGDYLFSLRQFSR